MLVLQPISGTQSSFRTFSIRLRGLVFTQRKVIGSDVAVATKVLPVVPNNTFLAFETGRVSVSGDCHFQVVLIWQRGRE